MGYNTDWNGYLETSRPFTESEINQWTEMAETRHDSEYHYGNSQREYPSIWCDFEISNQEGTGVFQWNGSEKTYEGLGWIKYFLNWTMKLDEPMVVKGRFDWEGEEEGDEGVVIVERKDRDYIIHIGEVEKHYHKVMKAHTLMRLK